MTSRTNDEIVKMVYAEKHLRIKSICEMARRHCRLEDKIERLETALADLADATARATEATVEDNDPFGPIPPRESDKWCASILPEVRKAGKAIASQPPAQWAGWVILILEALDGTPRSENFLQTVRLAITCRLDTGGW